MARGMALAGVDRSELTPPPPPQKPRGFFAVMSNFWYHYKWLVLGMCFFVGLAIWFAVDIASDNPPDYTIYVVTKEPLGEIWSDEMKAYLNAGAQDLDGDGEVEIAFENLAPYYYSEYAPTLGRTDNDRLQNAIAGGDVMLFAFDPYCYEEFMRVVESAASDEFVFFTPLDTDSPYYDAEKHAWNWLDDKRREEFMLADVSNTMYFGVRAVDGTAGGADSAQLAEDGLDLLYRLIDSASY